MNHITRLEAELAAARAEIDALRAGLDSVRSYVHSSKFSEPGPLTGYVNTTDVALRVSEAQLAATVAADEALRNELGPPVASGRTGWQCAACGEPLPKESGAWND